MHHEEAMHRAGECNYRAICDETYRIYAYIERRWRVRARQCLPDDLCEHGKRIVFLEFSSLDGDELPSANEASSTEYREDDCERHGG